MRKNVPDDVLDLDEYDADTRLTRSQRKQIKKAEKQARKEEQRRIEMEKHGGTKAIQSTQMAIPICDVYQGVVVTRDNRFLKILEFGAQNIMMYTNEKRNYVDSSFQNALRAFPAKVQMKVIARKAKIDALVGDMEYYLEQETVDACRELSEEYIQHLKETAYYEGVARRFLIIIEYEPTIAHGNSDFPTIRASLETVAGRIRQAMVRCGNQYYDTLDNSSKVIALLYDILNRKNCDEPNYTFHDRAVSVTKHYMAERRTGDTNFLNIPAPDIFAPSRIDYRHPNYIEIDGKYYAFGYIDGDSYVEDVALGWMSLFANAGEGVDVDIFLRRVPPENVRQNIANRIVLGRAKNAEASDVQQGALQTAEAVEAGQYLLAGIDSGQDFYYANILLTVCTDSLKILNRNWDLLNDMAKQNRFKLRRCTYQMEAAFNSTLPICKLDDNLESKSRRNMLASGAASLYPFISYELQDKDGIMVGTNVYNNSLVIVDIFNKKLHPNANVLIAGATGFGKTFTGQVFALRMRLQQNQVFILTPAKGKRDYGKVCAAVEGQFVPMGPGSHYYLNIMDIREKVVVEDDEDIVQNGSLLAEKVQSLHGFFSLIIRDLTQEEEQLLDGYIYQVYADYGITDDNNSIYVPGTNEYKTMPVIGDIYNKIADVPELRRIYHIISPIVNGSMSAFNQRTNIDTMNQYIVFDMDGLQSISLMLSLYIALDFITSKIKEDVRQRKVLLMDEAWKLIGEESTEMAAKQVQEIFRTYRVYNAAVFILTQGIAEFYTLKNGAYGSGIIGGCQTKVLLHLDKRQIAYLQENVTISPDDVERIEHFERGEALLLTGNSKMLVQIRASEKEQQIFNTNPEPSA